MRLPAPDIPDDTRPEQTRVRTYGRPAGWLASEARGKERGHVRPSFGSYVLLFPKADTVVHSLMGIFWKAARVGERLSPYISLCCVFMAVGCPLFYLPPFHSLYLVYHRLTCKPQVSVFIGN